MITAARAAETSSVMTAPPGAYDASAVRDQRAANVEFANELLETEISQRNTRKDAQEATARWIVVTAGILMTLLLTLARDAGILDEDTTGLVRDCFIAALVGATGAAVGAIGALWPRKYERLGKQGLGNFNQSKFLDQQTHEVTGQVVATRIGIAETMDANHEAKGRWLKGGFASLTVALLCLVAQGFALAADPPTGSSDTPTQQPPKAKP